MHQQVSVVTLGSRNLSRSKQFYADGLGWTPNFENEEIIFYQMNGLILGTFAINALEADMGRAASLEQAGFSLGITCRLKAMSSR